MSNNLARDGGPKRLAPVKIHDGMFRMQHGQLVRCGDSGGAALMDETLSGAKLHEGKAIPVTPGMTSRPDRGHVSDGFGHLRAASTLGDDRDEPTTARLPTKR